MKAFYRQRIPESSCARKETVDKDILVTFKNGDRKIMQSIRITRFFSIIELLNSQKSNARIIIGFTEFIIGCFTERFIYIANKDFGVFTLFFFM